MWLAGDVGGTKTLLGLFKRGGVRPEKLHSAAFRTLDYSDLESVAREFLAQAGAKAETIEGACVGVAGPVKDGRARLTNVPWSVAADEICRTLSIPRASVINDLEALAWSVPVLDRSEVAVLAEGQADPRGAAALIAAGTGLGIALLPKIDGRFVPMPSEGGHENFAPRNDPEFELARALVRRYGRADLEQVLSGPGLLNIARFSFPHRCADLERAERDNEPAVISEAAISNRCADCRDALRMFVAAYGAAAGDLALTALATGGVFIGGGIAPRILEALRWPDFLDAFYAKAPLEALMRRIPVRVILNPESGLLGAAVFASRAA